MQNGVVPLQPGAQLSEIDASGAAASASMERASSNAAPSPDAASPAAPSGAGVAESTGDGARSGTSVSPAMAVHADTEAPIAKRNHVRRMSELAAQGEPGHAAAHARRDRDSARAFGTIARRREEEGRSRHEQRTTGDEARRRDRAIGLGARVIGEREVAIRAHRAGTAVVFL